VVDKTQTGVNYLLRVIYDSSGVLQNLNFKLPMHRHKYTGCILTTKQNIEGNKTQSLLWFG